MLKPVATLNLKAVETHIIFWPNADAARESLRIDGGLPVIF